MVLKCIGSQAYKLELPEHLKVHDVFHVSLLKRYIPRADHVLNDDQIVMSTQGILQLQPSRILETRERKLRNRTQKQSDQGSPCSMERLPRRRRNLGGRNILT